MPAETLGTMALREEVLLVHPPPRQAPRYSVLAWKEILSLIILNALRDQLLTILTCQRFRVNGLELERTA